MAASFDPIKLAVGTAAVGVLGVIGFLYSPLRAGATEPEVPKTYSADAIEAWAAYTPKGLVKPFRYEPRPLGDNDVEVAITHCGICYSDIHQIDSGWSPAIYPIVPGHEIVGQVVALGPKVSKLKKGDRVGIGAQCSSCLKKDTCKECGSDYEQYCKTMVSTYNSRYPDGTPAYGGYAKKVRLHEHFAFLIPENLPSAQVAPLFCAGATVFEPLKRLNVGKGRKVGVIGIGGLGHLAVEFAVALGADVTAISRNDAKRETAAKLGAQGYLSTSNAEEMKKAERSFDVLISTDNGSTDFSRYLSLLSVMGTLVVVGLPEDKVRLAFGPLISKGVSLTGSLIASPSRIEEMLKLASEKKVLAHVQEFDISQVNEAIKGVREGKPRFRYVLKIQDLS